MLIRGRRAEILANNLANADTPNFKARDIDFASVLADVEGSSVRLRTTHAGHLGGAANVDQGELKYRYPLQPSMDGNTVDTQIEQAAFVRNAMEYQASLQFVNSKISGLIKALRGE
jgi:flagellar basal-body rod protein FlgB